MSEICGGRKGGVLLSENFEIILVPLFEKQEIYNLSKYPPPLSTQQYTYVCEKHGGLKIKTANIQFSDNREDAARIS